jgi:Pyridine nucleotide-disulphide oxidoreductase, dimerisation domain
MLFEGTIRPIIDGRMPDSAKPIVDQRSQTILGFHIVGERAVEIVPMAAIAIASKRRVDELAQIPLSFPSLHRRSLPRGKARGKRTWTAPDQAARLFALRSVTDLVAALSPLGSGSARLVRIDSTQPLRKTI